MLTKEEVYQRCKSHLLDYAGFRHRTSFEIREKANKYLDYYPDIGVEARQEIVDNILRDLTDLGLFSDLGFAKKYIEEQFTSRQPKSPNEVRAFLMRKGVSHENIDIALTTYDIYKQIDVIEQLVSKKKLPKDKMKNFLLRKGFTFDSVSQALETI